jgi:type I restriction enzyme S subunit
MVKGPGVVTGRYGTIGKVFFIEDDFWPLNTTLYVKDFKGNDPRFISYFLRRIHFNDYTDKAAVPGINRNALHGAEVVFPVDLPTQRAIAQILGSLDDKIDLNRRMNETLEAMARALFKSWFVDFEPFGRERPATWRIGKAEDFFDIAIGKTPPRKEREWFTTDPQDIVWVSISDMGSSGMFISDSSEYLTTESVKRFNIKIVPSGTVILSFKLTVGRVAITDGKMTTNEAIAHFKQSNEVTLEYLYCYLKSFDYQLLGSTSSIATAVNSKTIKAMPFVMPDEKVLTDFHAATTSLFERVRLNLTESRTLAALRDTLLPRLLSGKLRVKEAAEIAEGIA